MDRAFRHRFDRRSCEPVDCSDSTLSRSHPIRFVTGRTHFAKTARCGAESQYFDGVGTGAEGRDFDRKNCVYHHGKANELTDAVHYFDENSFVERPHELPRRDPELAVPGLWITTWESYRVLATGLSTPKERKRFDI